MLPTSSREMDVQQYKIQRMTKFLIRCIATAIPKPRNWKLIVSMIFTVHCFWTSQTKKINN